MGPAVPLAINSATVEHVATPVFQCSKCGGCCRRIKNVLPKLDRGDGVCTHLSTENLCRIYKDRPWICNVNGIYEKYFSNLITRQKFFEVTYEFCKLFQEEDRKWHGEQ